MYLFFGPETRYVGSNDDPKEPAWKREYLKVRRIDPTPIQWTEFIKPLGLCALPCVMIPAAAYSMIFLLSNVLATVEVPHLLQSRFELNAEQLGLQFLGPIIGSLIGEQLGGRMSDLWMNMRAKRANQKPEPEYRLWLSYFGYACSIVGNIVFLVFTEQAKQGQWNVVPIVGIAIGAAGNQLVTTVLITYAVDCHPEDASAVGVFITFVRQIWGFLGPFWYVQPPCEGRFAIANRYAGFRECSRMSVLQQVRVYASRSWLGSVFCRQLEFSGRDVLSGQERRSNLNSNVGIGWDVVMFGFKNSTACIQDRLESCREWPEIQRQTSSGRTKNHEQLTGETLTI